jgi:uncharacterized protein YhbP (UPF0306 family)
MIKLAFLLSQALVFPNQQDIYLEVVGKPASAQKQIFYAPHESEFVGNAYVADKVKKQGGAFIIMRQQGTRNVTLHIKEQQKTTQVYVDPNRLFTIAGIVSSIKKLNPKLKLNSSTTRKAIKRAFKLGKFVLAQLNQAKQPITWVAMHNNTEGFAGDHQHGRGDVSIYRYKSKLGKGENFLIDVNIADFHDEDNLFYVTEPIDFHMMRKYHWNVVLQNPIVTTDPKEDDGSLSVYAQMHHIRYINIEAERQDKDLGENSTNAQQEMVDFIYYLTSKNYF